jgi:hypothetical protein
MIAGIGKSTSYGPSDNSAVKQIRKGCEIASRGLFGYREETSRRILAFFQSSVASDSNTLSSVQ